MIYLYITDDCCGVFDLDKEDVPGTVWAFEKAFAPCLSALFTEEEIPRRHFRLEYAALSGGQCALTEIRITGELLFA